MAVIFAPDLPQQASPPVLPPVARVGGRERVITGSFEVATTDIDNTNDIILIAQIQSGDVLLELSTGHDDIDVGTALLLDIGLCDVAGGDIDTDGSSTSHDLFSSAVAGGASAVALTDRRFDDPAEDTVDQRLWELVNSQSTGTPFTNDPSVAWFICISINVVPTTAQAGTFNYRIRYVRD